ncbi:MAG: glycosyltransferase family 39 protein, partial [Candidatus Sumerlaeota bacterium]
KLALFDQQLLLGRLVSAIIGALTVIPVFLLARNLYGLTAGFVAGLAIAVAPMHVLNSHYLKEEVYLAFFVSLSTLFFVKWIARRKRSPLNLWFFLSAISAAAAMASKYIGVVAVLTLLAVLMVYTRGWKERLRLMTLAVALSFLTFLVLCPQLFLNFANFMRDFSYEASHGATGADRETLYFWQSHDYGLFYLREGILWGIGWPIALTAVLSVALFFARKSSHRSILLVVAIAVTWYLIAELTPAKRGVGRDRYVLSVLPMLAVLAGGFIHYVRRLTIPGARWWTIIFGIGLVIPSSWLTYDLITEMTPDTRERAQKFFETYYSEDDFRIINFGGYDPIFHPMARVSDRSPRTSTWEGTLQRMNEARFVATSSFALDRYEKYPEDSQDVLEQIGEIRAQFPYVARFQKEPRVSREFHNPTIEIRSKKSRENYLYEGPDAALKTQSEADQIKWKAAAKKKTFEALKKEQKELMKSQQDGKTPVKKRAGYDED